MIIDAHWLLVPLCLLVGVGYAAVLYFIGPQSLSRGLRWGLAAMRCVAVSTIALLLLAPVSKQTVHEQQQPLIAIVEDHTLSVQASADSAFSTLPLQKALQSHFRLKVEADTLNTHLTNLGQMLSVAPDAAAVVMASDGINNRGTDPVAVAKRLGIPVYTIALGDTTPSRDASIGDLRANRIALLNTSFPVELTLNAHGLQGQQATLNVSNSQGKTVHQQAVAYTDDNFSCPIAFTLEATEPGLQRYSIDLTVLPDEREACNNHLTFYVDVADTRHKIALIANAPHPDIAALKKAIESNPNYEVGVFMASEIERHRKEFRSQDYQLAILHNLPSRSHPDVGYASALPKFYIVGLQTDLTRFNALHTGLEIASQVHRADEVTALHHEGFTLFTFAPADIELIEHLPPLAATFGEARASAGAQSLFTARLGTINTHQPLVAATAQGAQRQVWIWGEGLWRWRLAEYDIHAHHEATDRLLSQLVAFAANSKQQNRLHVETARTYVVGEQPLLHAQLYNETNELTNHSPLTLHLDGDSLHADYQFLRDGLAYSLQLPSLPEGLYRYRASTPEGLTDEGAFAVEASNLEQSLLTANHALLRAISQHSGGLTYMPNQLDQLEEQLSQIKPTIHTHIRYAELLSLPAALALILLLLGAEWVLRKYHGEL